MANFLTLAETKFKEYEELVETTKHDEKEEEKKEYMKMASFIVTFLLAFHVSKTFGKSETLDDFGGTQTLRTT